MKGYLLFNVKTKRILSLSYKSKENKVFLKWLSGWISVLFSYYKDIVAPTLRSYLGRTI